MVNIIIGLAGVAASIYFLFRVLNVYDHRAELLSNAFASENYRKSHEDFCKLSFAKQVLKFWEKI